MLRVLVAEPDRADAKTLAYLLRLWGYRAETTADGPSLLRAAQTNPPDVVILGADLPQLDTSVAPKLLRGTLPERRLLIALTKGPPRATGFDHYLQKPVDVCELRRLLRDFASR
jgi:DNA-binding response OmpR family regulator